MNVNKFVLDIYFSSIEKHTHGFFLKNNVFTSLLLPTFTCFRLFTAFKACHSNTRRLGTRVNFAKQIQVTGKDFTQCIMDGILKTAEQ